MNIHYKLLTSFPQVILVHLKELDPKYPDGYFVDCELNLYSTRLDANGRRLTLPSGWHTKSASYQIGASRIKIRKNKLIDAIGEARLNYMKEITYRVRRFYGLSVQLIPFDRFESLPSSTAYEYFFDSNLDVYIRSKGSRDTPAILANTANIDGVLCDRIVLQNRVPKKVLEFLTSISTSTETTTTERTETMSKSETKMIIGTIDKKSGLWSIANQPVIHTNVADARREMERLAKALPDKKIVMLNIGPVASTADIAWQTI